MGDLNNIKYNEISDEDYHNLLNKKENFMEESERISENIKEINKNFLSKYNKIVTNMKNNINKLKDIKIINRGLHDEIKKLQDLMSMIKDKKESKKIEDNNKIESIKNGKED